MESGKAALFTFMLKDTQHFPAGLQKLLTKKRGASTYRARGRRRPCNE